MKFCKSCDKELVPVPPSFDFMFSCRCDNHPNVAVFFPYEKDGGELCYEVEFDFFLSGREISCRYLQNEELSDYNDVIININWDDILTYNIPNLTPENVIDKISMVLNFR